MSDVAPLPTEPRILTTTVGSYPVPDWLARLGASAVISVGAGAGDPGCPVFEIAERPARHGTVDIMNLLIDALSGRWLVWVWKIPTATKLRFPMPRAKSCACSWIARSG